MKISLSKETPDRPRHVVLVCEGNEPTIVAPVIARVLPARVNPVREFDRVRRQVKYRFHRKYLDTLLLAFPQAQKSPGLQRRLDKISSRELEEREREVPHFDIPGLWDFDTDTPAKPFNYQMIAIDDCYRFLMGKMDAFEENSYVEHFLENDEMGLGKTFIALCTLLRIWNDIDYDMKVLIVAPKNGKFVWERENNRWSGFDYLLVDADHMRPEQRNAAIRERATLTIINPEMLRGNYTWGTDAEGGTTRTWNGKHPDLFNFEYDIVIFDEYHRFGSPSSQQSQGMLELKAKRWLPMSGTPYLNRPTQLWPILHRCWPDRYPDYDMFVRACVIETEDGRGQVAGYDPMVMSELKKFIDLRSIRRRKDQVLKDLPQKHIITIPVELNTEQRRLYNRIRDEFILMLEDGSESAVINVMAQIMRLKQACFSPELYGGSKHSAKIDELKMLVRTLVDSGEKAIIFSEWSKATNILLREFEDYNPAYVDGKVQGSKRLEQADKFNNDEDCFLYIGTIGANREAVSLGAATHVIFTDKDWSPQVNDQAIGRSAAGGLRGLNAKVDRVTVMELYGLDTYEERVNAMLEEKRATFNALIERDGGARVSRSIVGSIRDLI